MRVGALVAFDLAERVRFFRSAACLFVGTLLYASPVPAGAADETDRAQSLSFTERVQPIFDAHCVVCHQYGAEQGGLSLEEGDAHENLVNVKSTQSPLQRVVPGTPSESYLLHKLAGTHIEVGGTGVRMPLSAGGNSAMSADEHELVTIWIEQGARDN